MNLLNIFLMAPAGAEQAQGGGSSLIMLVLIIAIFYFFMIRPQNKRQKEIREFREGLKKGDKVLTVSGVYGRIQEVKDTTVMLEIAPNVTIKIDKSGLIKDNTDMATEAK
ncbi:MAG: preprotein translocase subunit YajC [Salinivirgaceae bacterium]|nr:preprotein translocase subunit YajC [Salinivirgaceae bacterium]